MSDPTDGDRVFDDEFLRKLEHLKLVSSRVASGHLRGEHASRRRGAGLEFADYRPYVPGDDFRNVDWRAFLRLDRLLLRLYDEEADLPIYLLLDASGSMAHGDPSKLDYGRRVAAALAYIALRNLDRVHLVAAADGGCEEMTSRRGRHEILRAFRFLGRLRAGGATDLGSSVKACFSSRRRRGLVVLISDFLDPAGFQEPLDRLRYLRHDVFVVHLHSAEEARPRLGGEVDLVDAERHDACTLTVTAALLRAYEEVFREHCRGVEAYCWSHGWGYARTVTDFPFEDLVLQVFRQGRFLK